MTNSPQISMAATGAPSSVDKSGERVQRMFGQIADRYDLMNHVLSGGVDLYWRAWTVKRVPPQGELPILDVCTGTGDLAIAYWRAAAGKLRVVGTDFTPRMLELAEQKAAKLTQPTGAAKVEWIEADTQSLPFPDNQFQIVSVGFGLRNVSDTRAGLREMLRVCAPGGNVVVLEFSQPTVPGLAGMYRWYFRNVLPRIGQLFAKNREDAYSYLPDSVAEFPFGQALADIMRECGLSEVKFTPLTLGIATLYVGKKPLAAAN